MQIRPCFFEGYNILDLQDADCSSEIPNTIKTYQANGKKKKRKEKPRTRGADQVS